MSNGPLFDNRCVGVFRRGLMTDPCETCGHPRSDHRLDETCATCARQANGG